MNDAEQRLAALYDAWAHRVLAYATRQVGPTDADDVLAETYAVAWRRLDRVPAGDDALPWLLVVARNVVRNERRSTGRRLDLAARLRGTQPTSSPGAGEVVADRADVLHVLGLLSEREREALLLTAWDGLDHQAAARVSGCSARAFRARLTRARAHLVDALARPDEPPPGNAPATRHRRDAGPRPSRSRAGANR